MSEETVIAVVLTYNRLALLKECVAALQQQTIPPAAILVVDNGSDDETGNWLKAQSALEVISLQPNVGPAAGMRTGMEQAYKKGYDWIWVMDDDGLPHSQALQKLLEARPGIPAAKNSLVIDKQDRRSMAFKLKNYKAIDDVQNAFVEGEIMPWNGTLIHRTIFTILGFPRSELYLWGEEVEYYYRIKRSNAFQLFSVRESIHYHPRNNGFFYKGDWNLRTNDRAYYFIRNKHAVYLAAHKRNRLKACFHYCLFNAGMLYYILFYQKAHKLKKLKLQLLAAWDGFNNNYSKLPSDVQQLLKKI